MAKLPSIAALNELDRLKAKILSGHEAVAMLEDRAKKEGEAALVEAILVGAAIALAKELLPREDFKKWIAETKAAEQAELYLNIFKRSETENPAKLVTKLLKS